LESYEQALVKINRKSKTLTRQWQSQSQYAAHEEEKSIQKEAKTKEKKEMDRVSYIIF
jgi:RIO-like serine/threonine protein kinase